MSAKKKLSKKPKVISLFSGAGGLDLGLEAAGYEVSLCIENDEKCLDTLKYNRPQWITADPPDIFKITPKEIMKQAGLRKKELDLLAGGPPCQPFSKASYWRNGDSLRLRDPRAQTLNSYMEIVEYLLPKVILLENVEGIKFSNKDEGIKLLERRFREINKRCSTKYKPKIITINAAEFGVPQLRKRVFVIASRAGKDFILPDTTHGPGKLPYVTSWDAIGDLAKNSLIVEDLKPKGNWTGLLSSIPEGKNYQWHTSRGGGRPIFGFRRRFWSFLLKLAKDKPSWTIPAQPGPSTGPFHWDNRLLSRLELSRLQTFPDDYSIIGSRSIVQKQVGNAVPPLIAEIIGNEIKIQFLNYIPSKFKRKYVICTSNHIPKAGPVRYVTEAYLSFVGDHPPHPGVGKGPGALTR